jgi:transcriptional regulator with XRE-family HTH domain
MSNKTGERIAKLRKSLKLTQGQFADKIGLKFSAISMIELGKTPLTEANLRHICHTFDVNENWLRHGTGNMLKSPDNDEDKLIKMFRKLTLETREMVLKIVENFLIASEKQGKPPTEARETEPIYGKNNKKTRKGA